MRTARIRCFGLTGVALLMGGAAGAQEFDISRAALTDSTVFEPFVVRETRSLSAALNEGIVDRDTRLLVFETPEGPLALVTAQMAYHHLAQGDVAGQPWMVSF